MHTTKIQKSTASNAHVSKPFFNKSSEGGFFAQSKESQKPFFSAYPIQSKLSIGQPGDKYEQEADMMADRVVQKLENPSPSKLLQKKCTSCEKEEKVQKKEMGIMRKTIFDSENESTIQTKSIENQLKASKGRGKPMEKGVRSNMESAFGADFSNVKVHTDSASIQMNRDLNSRAFTNSSDVYFNSGEYNPSSKAGKGLLAHELTHVVQQRINIGQGRMNRQSLIQRDFINDTRGNPIAYEFRVGTELNVTFIGLARRLARDGLVTDDDLRQLRRHALSRRGTLNDHERMFMAGLLDPTNVAIFNGSRSGTNFQFQTVSITRARRDHVNNLDRALPYPVQQEIDDLTAAFARGDVIGILNEMSEIEAASAQAILSGAGSFHSQARSLLAFIITNRITAASTLTAMINGASDNSRGDRVLTGIVYAIASHARHGFANRVANGEIKVDALVPTALARLPGFSGREEAAYVTAAQAGGAKGDTMYVKTDLDIENTYHRSVVLHELQHAQDDASSSATGRPTFPIRNQLEARAYRSQARYIYDQLDSQVGVARANSASEIVGGMNRVVVIALVLEGQSNTARNRPLFNLINQQVPVAQRLTAAQIGRVFSASSDTLENRLLTEINTMYGLNNADQGVTEGLAGESIMDWINRI